MATNDGGNGGDSSTTSTSLPEAPVRREMVEAAKRFMLTPKVLQTPFEEQRVFLLGKGVTDREIDVARSELPPSIRSASTQGGVALPHPPPPPPPPRSGWRDAAQTVVLLGAIGYAAVRVLRSYVLPRFFDVPDPAEAEKLALQAQLESVQNTLRFVLDTVNQTSQAVENQKRELALLLERPALRENDVELQRLQTNITQIKSLLISQQTAATLPQLPTAGLPDWQRQSGAFSVLPPREPKAIVPPAEPQINGIHHQQQQQRVEEATEQTEEQQQQQSTSSSAN